MLVDNAQILAQLAACATSKPWAVWIKIDCGTHRGAPVLCAPGLTLSAGLQPTDVVALELAKAVAGAANCVLAGCYVHAGHSYYCRGVAQIKEVALAERNAVVAFKKMSTTLR